MGLEALKSNRKQEWSELACYLNLLFDNMENYCSPVDVTSCYG